MSATYIEAGNRNAPTGNFSVSVQEYDDAKWGRAVLVRVSSKAVVSLGFDLNPDDALKLAAALTKHATALNKAAEREAKLAALEML